VNAPVHRYNQIIGFATRPIAAGAHVHVHNLEVRDFARDYAFGEAYEPTKFVPPARDLPGHRARRRAGATRNYIGISRR
jgi:altronate hydrolase